MLRKLAATAAIAVALTSPALAQSSATDVLHKFFAEEWERGLRENPESIATLCRPRTASATT
jgi:hypothetical protein